MVASTPPIKTRMILAVGIRSPGASPTAGGAPASGPRPLHQIVMTPPIAAGWPITPEKKPSGCAHDNGITSSSALSLKFVTTPGPGPNCTVKMPGEASAAPAENGSLQKSSSPSRPCQCARTSTRPLLTSRSQGAWTLAWSNTPSNTPNNAPGLSLKVTEKPLRSRLSGTDEDCAVPSVNRPPIATIAPGEIKGRNPAASNTPLISCEVGQSSFITKASRAPL